MARNEGENTEKKKAPNLWKTIKKSSNIFVETAKLRRKNLTPLSCVQVTVEVPTNMARVPVS